MRSPSIVSLVVLIGLLAVQDASAADPQWSMEYGLPGVSGTVTAIASEGRDLYIGGRFDWIGDVYARGLAHWDGTQWNVVGDREWNHIDGLVLHEGELWAGGSVVIDGRGWSTPAARWDGMEWENFDGANLTAAVSTSQGLIATNQTRHLDRPEANLMRWHNGEFVEASAQFRGRVYDMCEWRDQIVIAGELLDAGEAPTSAIAAWDGFSWNSLDANIVPTHVPRLWGLRSVEVHRGELYVSGLFGLEEEEEFVSIAKWTGRDWQQVGDTYFRDQQILDIGGRLYSVGVAPDFPETRVFEWKFGRWKLLASPPRMPPSENAWFSSMAEYSGGLVLGGRFHRINGRVHNSFLVLRGNRTHSLPTRHQVQHGLTHEPTSVAGHEGELWVLGLQHVQDRESTARIAVSSRSGWLGRTEGYAGGRLNALISHDGQLFLAGSVKLRGLTQHHGLARWTGTAWAPVPGTTNIEGMSFIQEGRTLFLRARSWRQDGAELFLVGANDFQAFRFQPDEIETVGLYNAELYWSGGYRDLVGEEHGGRADGHFRHPVFGDGSEPPHEIEGIEGEGVSFFSAGSVVIAKGSVYDRHRGTRRPAMYGDGSEWHPMGFPMRTEQFFLVGSTVVAIRPAVNPHHEYDQPWAELLYFDEGSWNELGRLSHHWGGHWVHISGVAQLSDGVAFVGKFQGTDAGNSQHIALLQGDLPHSRFPALESARGPGVRPTTAASKHSSGTTALRAEDPTIEVSLDDGNVDFRFRLSTQTSLSMQIYDVRGRLVATPFQGTLPAGTHELAWAGRDRAGARVARGSYFVMVRMNERTQVSRFMWLADG